MRVAVWGMLVVEQTPVGTELSTGTDRACRIETHTIVRNDRAGKPNRIPAAESLPYLVFIICASNPSDVTVFILPLPFK